LVLLGAVIAVFGWLRPHKETSTAAFQKDMDETLEHFVQELAMENDKLLQVIEKMKQEQDAKHDATRRRMDKLEAGIHLVGEKLDFIQTASYSSTSPSSYTVNRMEHDLAFEAKPDESILAVHEEIEVKPKRSLIRNRYTELFQLLDQGFSVDEAARELQMPVGEVQLIIQLASQEEQDV